MKSSTFILKVKKSEYEIIDSFGQYGISNYSYPLPSENPKWYFNEALKNGRVINQTQSNPDQDGFVVVTVSIEH